MLRNLLIVDESIIVVGASSYASFCENLVSMTCFVSSFGRVNLNLGNLGASRRIMPVGSTFLHDLIQAFLIYLHFVPLIPPFTNGQCREAGREEGLMDCSVRDHTYRDTYSSEIR